MSADIWALIAADTVLVLHVLFVAFVVLGLLTIVVGGVWRWEWVRNPWLRLAHLASVGVVVLEAWLGIVCPLTHLEMALRRQAGDATYRGDFIGYWLNTILYYDASPWVFIVCYTVFGMLVVGSWIWIRPRPFGVPVRQGSPIKHQGKPE
ncbi:MAG: hypothetical protein CMQ61_09820 [Gammaproteobacteria bacterium]|nr:hypothetical protein [Gammaproteobacteria bacterium]